MLFYHINFQFCSSWYRYTYWYLRHTFIIATYSVLTKWSTVTYAYVSVKFTIDLYMVRAIYLRPCAMQLMYVNLVHFSTRNTDDEQFLETCFFHDSYIN